MNIEKCTKCNVEYDPIFGHRVCPDCRRKEDHIRSVGLKAKAFCQAHGLYWDISDDGWVTIGQSGFNAKDVEASSSPNYEKTVQLELEHCLQEHRKIESVEWEDGLLYDCLHAVDDGPTRSAIEDELAAVLPRDVLNKVVRVFYKHTKC